METFSSIGREKSKLQIGLNGLGYILYKKKSSIEHYLAGNGVFLSCVNQQIVIPGTLLGYVPGVIQHSHYPMPINDSKSDFDYLFECKYKEIYMLINNQNLISCTLFLSLFGFFFISGEEMKSIADLIEKAVWNTTEDKPDLDWYKKKMDKK